MFVLGGCIFRSEVFMTVHMDTCENGFVAKVENHMSGYKIENYGKTVGALMNELLMWAGIDELIFDVNDSIETIRDVLEDLKEESEESDTASHFFEIIVHTSF